MTEQQVLDRRDNLRARLDGLEKGHQSTGRGDKVDVILMSALRLRLEELDIVLKG